MKLSTNTRVNESNGLTYNVTGAVDLTILTGSGNYLDKVVKTVGKASANIWGQTCQILRPLIEDSMDIPTEDLTEILKSDLGNSILELGYVVPSHCLTKDNKIQWRKDPATSQAFKYISDIKRIILCGLQDLLFDGDDCVCSRGDILKSCSTLEKESKGESEGDGKDEEGSKETPLETIRRSFNMATDKLMKSDFADEEMEEIKNLLASLNMTFSGKF